MGKVQVPLFKFSPNQGKTGREWPPRSCQGSILEPCVLPADPALPPHLTQLFLGTPQGSWEPNQPQSLPSSLCHSALIRPLLPTGSWEWIGVSLHHGGGELLREEHMHISRRPSITWPKSALGKHMLS